MHDLTINVVPFDLDKDGALYDDWSLGTWIQLQVHVLGVEANLFRSLEVNLGHNTHESEIISNQVNIALWEE